MKNIFFGLFLIVTNTACSAENKDGAGQAVCGLSGSIQERLKDCNYQKGDFALVARTKDNNTVFQNIKTGLIWGDRFPGPFPGIENAGDSSFMGAKEFCAKGFSGIGDLMGFSWRLPTHAEYVDAENGRVREVFPDMQHYFWSGEKGLSDIGGIYSGRDGTFHIADPLETWRCSFRCVAIQN
jgi:hypothetical protein